MAESNLDSVLSDVRVKVDRQLLTVMLSGGDPAQDLASASDFFVDVSNKSGAIISYPRKRRLAAIGAKEPEILLIGSRQQVESARNIILESLDPFRNRVTIKIDVSHCDHSHVIGKNGKRVQAIMDSTDTHIHFPDGNRSNTELKSNQVTIAGTSLQKTEEARHLVRQNLPLTMSFAVPMSAKSIGLLDSAHPNIQYFQISYGVIITFRCDDESLDKSMVRVSIRGTRIKFEDIKEAALKLYEYLTGSTLGFNNIIVSIAVEIASQHHMYVKGRANCNVKAITAHTGATVAFPYQPIGSPAPITHVQKTTVVIRGRGVESAFMAWIELLGYLPMLLIFDLKPNQAVDGPLITSLMANQMLSIIIRPKPRANTKSIAIKGQERHSSLLYRAKNLIMNGESDDVFQSPSILPPIPMTDTAFGLKSERKSFTQYLMTDMETEVSRSFQN